MTVRSSISLKTKLASALLQVGEGGVPFIPYDDAKQMTADQVVSLFHFDHHPIPKAHGGPDEPWNLMPRLIVLHRRKTATVDAPVIAKTRRIATAHTSHQEVRRNLLRPHVQRLPKKRKLVSRGFDKTKSRKFSGQIVPRRS